MFVVSFLLFLFQTCVHLVPFQTQDWCLAHLVHVVNIKLFPVHRLVCHVYLLTSQYHLDQQANLRAIVSITLMYCIPWCDFMLMDNYWNTSLQMNVFYWICLIHMIVYNTWYPTHYHVEAVLEDKPIINMSWTLGQSWYKLSIRCMKRTTLTLYYIKSVASFLSSILIN